MLPGLGDRLVGATSLGNDGHAPIGFQQGSQAAADHVVVVAEKDADGIPGISHGRSLALAQPSNQGRSD